MRRNEMDHEGDKATPLCITLVMVERSSSEPGPNFRQAAERQGWQDPSWPSLMA